MGVVSDHISSSALLSTCGCMINSLRPEQEEEGAPLRKLPSKRTVSEKEMAQHVVKEWRLAGGTALNVPDEEGSYQSDQPGMLAASAVTWSRTWLG